MCVCGFDAHRTVVDFYRHIAPPETGSERSRLSFIFPAFSLLLAATRIHVQRTKQTKNNPTGQDAPLRVFSLSTVEVARIGERKNSVRVR